MTSPYILVYQSAKRKTALDSGIVSGGGGGGGAAADVFSSDWSTATGQTLNAVSDGSKWNFNVGHIDEGANSVIEVVNCVAEGISVGAPSTNCLRINTVESGGNILSGQVGINGLWNTPANGQSRWAGMWLYCAILDSVGNIANNGSHHPMESANGSEDGTGYQWEFYSKNNGTFPWQINTQNGGGANNKWLPYNAGEQFLSKNVWLYIEWKRTKVGVNSYTFDTRITSALGIRLYSSTGDGTLGTISNSSGVLMNASPLASSDAEAKLFQVGSNGGSCFLGLANPCHRYIAKFGVSSIGWIGA